MAIRYTRHARHKFGVLAQHGFPITEQHVAEALIRPDVVIPQSEDRCIAQKRIGESHVLRVVYREEDGDLVVITLYPGRRERYESTV